MKKNNFSKALVVLSLFVLIVVAGCGSTPTNGTSSSTTPSSSGSTKKVVDTCMTLEDFDNLLPADWPNSYTEDAVRTCDNEDDNGCCESVGVSMASEDQENFIGLWLWAPDKDGKSAWSFLEDYANTATEAGDTLTKGEYKGYQAYEYSDISGLFIAVEPYVVQVVWVGSSQEEVDAALSALKIY